MKDTDRWPRWLRPAEAAAYIGKPKSRLLPLVAAGLLPEPSYHLGPKSPRYDRQAIDSMMLGTQHADHADAVIARMFSVEKVAPSRRRPRSSAK